MMALVLSTTLSYSHKSTRQQLNENEQVILELLAGLSQTALFSVEFGELQQYMDRVVQNPHILHIMVADRESRVVVSTNFSDVGSAIPKQFSDSDTVFWERRSLDGQGTIAILFSNAALFESTKAVTKLGIMVALFGMVIIAIAGTLSGFLLTRRLAVLSDVARRFADGNLSVRTGFHSDDEVGTLGQTFDEMTGKITHTIAELETSRVALQLARDDLEVRVQERTEELEEANRQLQSLSESDALTQIANRRRFDSYLQQQWARARRSEVSLSLLLIDIDYFKLYNDNYGHQAGDNCLIIVAQTIAGSVHRQGQDLAARYGGEEFAVILPETDLAGAFTVAENIQCAIAAAAIPHEASLVIPMVTLSIGVASCHFGEGMKGYGELIKEADNNLYLAKERGRNRINGNESGGPVVEAIISA